MCVSECVLSLCVLCVCVWCVCGVCVCVRARAKLILYNKFYHFAIPLLRKAKKIYL